MKNDTIEQSIIDDQRPSTVIPKIDLSIRATVAWTVVAVVSFKLAFAISVLSLPAIFVYAVAVTQLTNSASSRSAFYSGLTCGTTLAAIELTFLQSVFGQGAIGLWMVFGIWLGLFTLTGRLCREAFPEWGRRMLPVLWMAFEYFRSELYYLRFSWVTPGLALTSSPYEALLWPGQYGAGAIILLIAVIAEGSRITPVSRRIIPAVALLGVWAAFGALQHPQPVARNAPVLTGIQLEHPSVELILDSLERALQDHKKTDLFVLSEYTLDGPVPEQVLDWCKSNKRYLIVGGKDPLGGGEFYNTAFVIGPTGDIVHQQVKAVPIQFFRDGKPALSQDLWESPWGKIGIAICYDMSYTRVIDRLVAEGANAIINPTMDPVGWGTYEHEVHSRIPICRAREYCIPVVRIASSGVSVFTHGDGSEVLRGSFPGQGEVVTGRLSMSSIAARPIDRWLAPLSILITAVILACLLSRQIRIRRQQTTLNQPTKRRTLSI